MSAIVANCAINLNCELTEPVKVQYLDGNLFSMDNAGNTAHVYVYYNGQPQEIVGSVSADVIRADGSTVAVTGAMSGNRAYVIFPQAVYAVPGVLSVVIKATEGTTTTTIAAFVANVYQSSTDTVVDPGTIIPSVDALIAAIQTAVASIPSDYSALLATIATDYSPSKPYPNVGSYAWYGGVLKRSIVPITTAETYDSSHWTNAILCDDVSALKSAIKTVESGNLSFDIIKNSYVKQNGDIANYPGWNRTDYVPCTPGKKLYVNNSVQTSYCYWYDAEKGKISPGGQLILAANLVNSPIVPPSGAYYFIVSNTAAGMASFSVRDLTLYDEYIEQSNMIENVRNTSAQKEIINLFDKTNITENKYLSTSTGDLLNDSTNSFFASDFIYIGDLEKVIISGTHIVCWYDESKVFVSCPESMNSGTNDITLTIPSGVKYMRFSAYKTSLNMAQIGESVSRSNYFPYGYYTLPGLLVDGDAIIVDASGNGDYTSFTLAMKENYDNKKDVIVKPGTYNIVTEYTAIWGAEAVAAMADADGEIFDGWQYGVKLNGRKITFQPGAKLVCDWTGHTVNGTHRFSALRVEKNVEIIGLDLDGTNLFYVIHDDYGDNNSQYTNIYRNCRVIGHNISNANCIGGGCKKYSRHIIENCYFDNGGLASSTTVRYHNTNADGAVPELFISNSYFNGWVTPRYYGTQTSKMRAYINNCKAQKIAVIAESGSYTTENVDLYKWCNEEAE